MDGCVEVDVAVELLLGVVSRVDPGTGVLGGVDVPQVEGGSFGGFKSCFGLEIGGRQTTLQTTLEKH